jgi:molybdate transport system substrate-binding protein
MVFADLKERGLDSSAVLLGIMDGLPGLGTAFTEAFLRARVARCWVHKARNVFPRVPKRFQSEFKVGWDAVQYAESGEAARAAADTAHMDALAATGVVAAPEVFARNELVLVLSAEGAGALGSFADLPKAARVVVGAPEVPVGRYTDAVLAKASAGSLGADFRARVEARIVSRELNVRQVLAKVALGEAQAGIVYRTDALTAPAGVVMREIPAELNVTAAYPVAVVTRAPQPDLARAFIERLRGPAGREALQARGFMPAP